MTHINLETYLHNAVGAMRKESLDKSDQLTLGELILKLEPIAAKQEAIKDKYQHEATVVFDFEYLFPTEIDSWRGSYNELALNFVSRDMDNTKEPMTVSAFLALLRNTIGKVFQGYKGGDFTMSRHTPLWVANYGNSGNTAVIDAVDNEYEVILMTGYRKY